MEDRKKEQIEQDYKAVISQDGLIIINRAQRYVEDLSEGKVSPEELKGMVRLIKHIKDAKEDFKNLRG